MQKRAILALMLALAMLLSSCSLIVRDEEVDNARVIVRVGETEHNKAEVKAMVDYQLAYMSYLYAMYGLRFDATDAAQIQQAQEQVVNSLVQQDVIQQKIAELGLDQLTEEETAELEESTKTQWAQYREDVKGTLNLAEDATEEEITAAVDAACAENGVDEEYVRQSEKNTLLSEKLRNHIVKDVAVSEEELKAGLDSKVESAKSSYASNLSAYGNAVMNNSTVYYRPAGYRMVKQILVKFTAEDEALMKALDEALNAVVAQQNSVVTALNDAEVTNMDELAAQVQVELETPEGATAAEVAVKNSTAAFGEDVTLDEETKAQVVQLAELKAKRAYLEAEQTKAKEQALANIVPKADEVLAKLGEGADWDELAATYNEDPGMMADSAFAKTGYPVCEGFTGMDSAFVSAAMAIQNVGEWSNKTEGSYGYYIIQYVSDVAEGPVDVETVREPLTKELLTAEQNTVYDAQIQSWVDEADAFIDLNALRE